MSCPTCDHTMAKICTAGVDDLQRNVFWCERCGTIKILGCELPLVPDLVFRVRQHLEEPTVATKSNLCEGALLPERRLQYLKAKTKTKRFVRPTVEQVAAYCHERQNSVDPQSFVDHYEANGWRRGKTPIKDWRACVRTWERRHAATTSNDKLQTMFDKIAEAGTND